MMSGRKRLFFYNFLAAAALLIAGCGPSAPEAPPGAAASIDVTTRFTALWWSPEQMEGLDPNNPPPKNTEVELDHWEYTDPIAVPNPDVVTLVISLQNKGNSAGTGLTVTTNGQWNIGPLQDESKAMWTQPFPLGPSQQVEVAAGSKHTLRVPVDLKQMMEASRRSSLWPHDLRVIVEVTGAGANAPLGRSQVDFAIQPGD